MDETALTGAKLGPLAIDLLSVPFHPAYLTHFRKLLKANMNVVMEKSFLGQSLSQSSSALRKQVRQAFVQRAWSARATDLALRSACFP